MLLKHIPIISIAVTVIVVILSLQTTANATSEDFGYWMDDDIYSLDFDNYTCNPIESDELPNCHHRVIFLGTDWISLNSDYTIKNCVIDYLKKGSVVIFTNNNIFNLVKENLPVCYTEDSSCYAMAYDSNQDIIHCYSDNYDNDFKSSISIENWIERIDLPTRSITYFSGDWGSSVIGYSNKDCGEWGSFNIFFFYYWVEENNYGYNQYACKYSTQVVPAEDHYVDYFEPQVTLFNYGDTTYRYLTGYSPTRTVSESTINVNLGFNLGVDLSLNGSIGWSYTIPDISVEDYSNRDIGLFKARYNYNVRTSSSYLFEPGITSIVDCDNGFFTNGTFMSSDSFTVRFYKIVEDYFLWIHIGSHIEYESFTLENSPNIKGNPRDLTIDGNGYDGNSYVDEGLMDFQSSITQTFAQGGHTNLSGEGYYKYGYTLAGFSTDPYATVPSLTVGQDYKVNDNVILYCIWQRD